MTKLKRSLLNPATEKIKIRNVWRVRDSGIVVETQGEEDLQKLIDNPELKENGFTVEKPGKRRPKLIVYDVPKSMSEDELLEAIYDQNEETVGAEETQFREKFKLAFRIGGNRQGEFVNWIADMRHNLRRSGRLFIGWNSCRVQDFVGLSRCYKCQNYGHIAKNCIQEKDTCGHCGADGHRARDCPKKNEPGICILRKRALNGPPTVTSVQKPQVPKISGIRQPAIPK